MMPILSTPIPATPIPATPILLDGPAVEPVSLAEMRAYLRRDDGAEDDLVGALVTAARLAVEAAAGRVLIESRWRVTFDGLPSDRVVRLPVGPVIAVERLRALDAAGPAPDLDPTLYRVEAAGDPARIVIDAAAPWPTGLGGLAIEIRAGYGATPDAVPAPLRHAVRMTVARWFEHRGDEGAQAGLSPDILALVAPFRRPRL